MSEPDWNDREYRRFWFHRWIEASVAVGYLAGLATGWLLWHRG